MISAFSVCGTPEMCAERIAELMKSGINQFVVGSPIGQNVREAIDLVDKDVASAEDVDRAFCMGIGLRDPIIGPFLRIHLAGGGVERFIETLSQSYRYRWETMEAWTSIPPSAEKKMVKSVREMEMVRTKTWKKLKSGGMRCLSNSFMSWA
jgi:3-hydroxyacyl-CoA dehydrogenase